MFFTEFFQSVCFGNPAMRKFHKGGLCFKKVIILRRMSSKICFNLQHIFLVYPEHDFGIFFLIKHLHIHNFHCFHFCRCSRLFHNLIHLFAIYAIISIDNGITRENWHFFYDFPNPFLFQFIVCFFLFRKIVPKRWSIHTYQHINIFQSPAVQQSSHFCKRASGCQTKYDVSFT